MRVVATTSFSATRPDSPDYWLALLLLLCFVTSFADFAYRGLSEPDEGRYAEIPREMLASGDWITPHLNGIPYLEKPPLQYWATAAAYAAFGVEPWVARLWGGTLGFLGLLVAFLTGRMLWGRRTGECAMLILASMPLYYMVSHINTLDIGLAFFLNATLACLVAALRAPADSVAERGWLLLGWTAIALGFLQKGLVAAVLPTLTLIGYSLCTRDWTLWRRLHPAEGIAITSVICLPWVVLVAARNPGFLQFFFVHEHFARFATTVHHRSEAWWFFPVILATGSLPWLPVMVRSAFAVRPGRQNFEPATPHWETLLLLWAIVQVGFFSLSGSKLAPYIVGAASPLAILTAHWLQQRRSGRALLPVACIALAVWAPLIAYPQLIERLFPPGMKQSIYLQLTPWVQAATMLGIAGAVFALGATFVQRQRAAVAAVGLGFLAGLCVLMFGTPVIDSLRIRPGLAAEIAPHLPPHARFYCVGEYSQTLPFQLGRTCTVTEWSGELEWQFDRGSSHSLRGLTDFVTHWHNDLAAVAIVRPDLWQRLQEQGFPARVVAHDRKFLVVAKP